MLIGARLGLSVKSERDAKECSIYAQEIWKGKRGIHCAGLSRRGISGVSMDAEAIADDLNLTLNLVALVIPMPT